MAVRYNCPIYIEESILKTVGSEALDEDEDELGSPVEQLLSEPESDSGSLSSLSPAELDQALKKAIDSEDYELAARLRDELSKRK